MEKKESKIERDNIPKELKLALNGGVSISVGDGVRIYPLTLREISHLSEKTYNEYLSLLTFDVKDLKNKDIQISEIKSFDVLVGNCYYEEEFAQKMETALTLFLKESITFMREYLVFYIGNVEEMNKVKQPRFVHRDNFEDIVKILKYQNCIKDKRPTTEHKNKKTKMLAQKRDQGRNLIAKSEGRDEISLSDLLSCLGVFYQDLTKVYDLTVFQLYDQYERFMRQENYKNNFEMYLVGADTKKLNLEKHWTSKQ